MSLPLRCWPLVTGSTGLTFWDRCQWCPARHMRIERLEPERSKFVEILNRTGLTGMLGLA